MNRHRRTVALVLVVLVVTVMFAAALAGTVAG